MASGQQPATGGARCTSPRTFRERSSLLIGVMSLADLLPAPKNRLAPPAQKSAGAPGGSVRSLQVAGKKTIPPYGNRAGYIPRTDADFDDGGAFPEIHRLQFPLGMGRRDNSGMSTALATISVSADGDVDYSGVVTQRIRKDQLVQKSLDDLRPKDPSAEELARPDAETEQAVTVCNGWMYLELIGF